MKNKILKLSLAAVMAFSLMGTGCVAGQSESDSSEKDPVAKVQSEKKSTAASSESSEQKKSDEKQDESKAEKKSEAAVSISKISEEKEPEPDYEALYRLVLENMVKAVQERDPSYAMGIGGLIDYSDPVNELGYTIMDVSGDGIPELIVTPTDPASSYMVLSLYTIANGTPQYVLEGYARSMYYYNGGNRFSFIGSGGVSTGAAGEFTLSEDGTTPNWTRCVFSEMGDSIDDVSVYSNTNGSWDPASSDFVSKDLNDFSAVSQEIYDAPKTSLTVTPFANFR